MSVEKRDFKIYIASDHAGFQMKYFLIYELNKLGYKIIDKGSYQLEMNDDYPDFIHKAATEVSDDPQNSVAIVLGGSGQGEAIASNRYRHVRAIVYYGGPTEILRLGREDNNSNVLSLGARFLRNKDALNAVLIWLKTNFSEDERHIRRIKKIECMPHSHSNKRHD